MSGNSRETKVVLSAQVAGYLSGFEQARNATSQTKEESAKLEAQLQKQHAAMTTIGTGMAAFGAAAVAAVGLAVAKYAEFDKQMSAVQAATHESAENMNLLRDAAIEAGATTAYSATEAAQAIEELSKAGVTTADILGGGLSGSLALAAAGNLEVGQAAEIAATAMTQFGKAGSEVPHIADLLAAGAGKAQGTVDDLSQALNQGGLVASQAGFSIEETTGALSAFAAAGLVGSDAGTSLKTAILALQNPSKKSRDLMEDYGLEVYNADGSMKSMSEISGILASKLGGLDDETRNAALAQIFGNDAVRAANVLYANGAQGITDWTKKVDDAGYAAETAAIMQDNLAGDLEKLGGAFDTLLIKTGSSADGPLRAIVQDLTDLVDAVSEIPAPVQAAGLALGTFVAGGSLIAGSALVIIPKLVEMKAALEVLSTSSIPGVASSATTMSAAVTRSGSALAATARFMTGPWGVGLAVAAVGVQVLSEYLESLRATSEEVSNALVTAKTSAELFDTVSQGRAATAWADVRAQLGDLPDLLAHATEQQDNWLSRFGGREYFGGIQALKDIGAELATLSETNLPGAQDAFTKLAAETDGSKEQLTQLLDAMPEYRDALVDQATQAGQSASDTNLLTLAQGTSEEQVLDTAAAYIEQIDAGEGVADMLNDLIEQINNLNGTHQDAVASNAAFLESLDKISLNVDAQKDAYEETNGTLEGFTVSLDEATAAGSANASSLSDVAAKAQEAAESQFSVDQATMSSEKATEKYVQTLRDQRVKFEEAAVAAGYSKDEVQKLADRVFALPTAREIKIMAETSRAQADLNAFITRNDGRVISVRQQLITEAVAAGAARGDANAAYRADGAVVDYYAEGGVRENHVAEIAPAGSWRVWAEPETEGEAYIPLAQSKRSRSLEILRDVADRFGVESFGDGGLWAGNRYVASDPAENRAVARAVEPQSGPKSATTFMQHIHPAPGMSEAEIARVAIAEYDFEMRGI